MAEDDPLAGILGDTQETNADGFSLSRRDVSDSGVDPGLLSPDLLAACKANYTARARELIADDVPPGYTDPDSGWSCLHWAVYNGNPGLTLALVQAGASSGYRSTSSTLSQGRKSHKYNPQRAPNGSSGPTATDTPLHWSAYRGDLRITWILLKEGYSPNDVDNMGNTVTHLAAANGHEHVLDTLVRDGADVHRQNKFKNTPHDVANSAQCRGLLRKAEAFSAPTIEDAELMHRRNLQRILEAEHSLVEAVGTIEKAVDEQDLQQQQQQQQQQRQDEINRVADRTAGEDETDGQQSARQSEEKGEEAGRGGVVVPAESKDSVEEGSGANSDLVKEGRGQGEGGGDGRNAGPSKSHEEAASAANGQDAGNGDAIVEATVGGEEKDENGGSKEGQASDSIGDRGGGEGDKDGDGNMVFDEEGVAVLAQVTKIREAVAGAEALCICDELVEAAKLKVEGLLLQHSIEKQAARVLAASPVLTQETYTTLVNRLMLLLKRAEGNPRIKNKLRERAQALVEKSHAEYWLQVAARRLEKVECAEPQHVRDMDKLEAGIDQATKAGAQAELVQGCHSLLRRLTTEVEISKAVVSFPNVRLPIEVMPKDYWQPADMGYIEETEGFPLPPVDEEGKPLDYVWVPSKSLRELSAACKRTADALVGVEGLNPALVERGTKRLQEAQKELKVLQEKDNVDKDKAISTATKAAKKLKKKGGKKKK